jgi:hypothetical protein
MKKDKLKINTIYYSKRFKCFGQCLKKKDFMAYMIWSLPGAQPGWYPCTELVYDVTELK